jgi:hypothetical protein
VGLAGLLGEEAAALGCCQELLVDLAVVERADGDQVVEVAGRLPQLAVALADRGGGDPGELFGQRPPRIATTGAVSDGWELDWTGWSLALAGLEPLEQHSGYLPEWGLQIAPGGPLVGVAAGVAAGWGDHIAATAPPIHMLEVAELNVAEAGWGNVVMPAAPTGADQRPGAAQAMLGR